MNKRRVLIGLATLAILGSLRLPAQSRVSLEAGFGDVPPEARLRMYWRVFGPAWTRPEIDRQLAIMKSAGLGGVTIYFLYPIALDDPAGGIVNQRFGSPEFLADFGYAAERATALGLRLSVNGGTGWPYGGPTVTPRDAAQRLREIRVPAGKDTAEALRLGADEHLVAAFFGASAGEVNLRDVTDEARRGSLPAPLPTELRLYISGPSGMLVKRPSFGGEGAAVSHYDSGPLLRWLAANVQPLLDASPGRIAGIGCDSLEVYRSNWTADLPREFAARRGYSLVPHLPELFDDGAAAAKSLRFDFWRTLAELAEERFTAVLGRWCRDRGVALEMEPYGTPPNPMTAASHIKVPTGEHYEWKGFSVQKYVASMARINGRPVVGAEAWTWAGLPNRLGDSLGDLKLVSDMTFLAGANDLTGVDFPYSPEAAGTPGWLPYFGPVMGTANPQWRFFPALVSYLNRCQWMLRQGEPVRKVAVYLPVEDAFAAGPVDQMLLDFAVRDRLATGKPTSEFGLGNALRHHSGLLRGLVMSGYDYDGLDFWAVARSAKAKSGRLAVGPASYEAVVLPNLELIDAEAMEKIAEFCRAGGTVVATERLPAAAAGLGVEAKNERVRRFVGEIFGPGATAGPASGKAHPCGRGRGIFVARAGDAALALHGIVTPSVVLTPPDTVGFVHRATKDRDIYFVANIGSDSTAPNGAPVRVTIEYPGPERRLEIWDPMSGQTRLASASGSRLDVDLPVRSSVFIVAGKRASPVDAVSPDRAEGGHAQRVALDLGWTLTFEGPGAPPPATLRDLVSWTELPGGRYFSGAGVYRASFDQREPLPRTCRLRFESIREAAEVKLNGRPLGILFNPPWSVDAGSALRQGRNDLEITVVNLPLNRFLGLPDQDLAPLRAKFGTRFPDPGEKKAVSGPAPSGLIGRVWLEVLRSP